MSGQGVLGTFKQGLCLILMGIGVLSGNPPSSRASEVPDGIATGEFIAREVRAFIQKKKITDVKTFSDAFYDAVPEFIHRNVLFLHVSESEQGATDLFPRMLIFSKSGETVLAINQPSIQELFSPGESGEHVEIREATASEISYFQIKLQSSSQNLVKAESCQGCHHRGVEKTQIIWDSRVLSKVYGGPSDSYSRTETFLEKYETFQKFSGYPQNVYEKWVKNRNFIADQDRSGRFVIQDRPVLRFTAMNAKWLSREAANALSGRLSAWHYRYAFMGAFLGCSGFESFFPVDRSDQPSLEEKENHLLEKWILGTQQKVDWNLQLKDGFPEKTEPSDSQKKSYQLYTERDFVQPLAQFRYVFEPLFSNQSDKFLFISRQGFYSFMDVHQNLHTLGYYYAQKLKEKDPYFESLPFELQELTFDLPELSVSTWSLPKERLGEVCTKLQSLSQASLKNKVYYF